VRAAAESTSLPPAPAAAASIAKALAQMQLPKPRTDVHQPQQIPQPVSQPRQESYKEAARAAAPSFSLGDPIPPPPSASRTEDSGGTKARHDISADGALSVLAGLAEIREMKAGSLERSLERESVRRRHGLLVVRCCSRLTLSCCRCSSAILRILKPSLHLFLYVAYQNARNCISFSDHIPVTHAPTGAVRLSRRSFI
jgi:hypothetical protein